MHTIQVIAPSYITHGSQIVTGFAMLAKQGYDVQIVDHTQDKNNPFYGLPVVLAEYRGKKLFYDLWDGYNNPDDIQQGLYWCDYFFKRSFDPKRNARLFPRDQHRIFPLGFNYHVTCEEDPIQELWWKAMLNPIFGRAPDKYFTPDKFEGKAARTEGPVKILFLTRLWPDDPELPEEANLERQKINWMRIHMIRTLRERYGDNFVGGLNDMGISQQLAPDLILPAKYTERKKYLKLLHSCDICIGTMGLFESIGWKTGEYVAAAKAIVNETLHYQVPGDFTEGKHYFSFTNAQECLDAVERLVNDRELLYQMQKANEEYYQNYLRPDVLVKNTLELVDRELDQ